MDNVLAPLKQEELRVARHRGAKCLEAFFLASSHNMFYKNMSVQKLTKYIIFNITGHNIVSFTVSVHTQ